MQLDVRGLPPPEPFVRIMQTLPALPAGTALQVRIHREPHPLYDALRDAGYVWQTAELADGSFQVIIRQAP